MDLEARGNSCSGWEAGPPPRARNDAWLWPQDSRGSTQIMGYQGTRGFCEGQRVGAGGMERAAVHSPHLLALQGGQRDTHPTPSPPSLQGPTGAAWTSWCLDTRAFKHHELIRSPGWSPLLLQQVVPGCGAGSQFAMRQQAAPATEQESWHLSREEWSKTK